MTPMAGRTDGIVRAVLGPTNTGKTHLAIERMCAHSSGVIGFPLRLLAREVYDRVVKLKGESRVALLTGEERIAPPTARYWLCTAESMPVPNPSAVPGGTDGPRTSPSARSTRRSSAPIPSAATSSPTECFAPAAARRR